MHRGLVLVTCLLATAHAMGSTSIVDTAHNLSVSGKGQFKSKTEDRICIFCHTSHSSTVDAPMWNRRSNGYVSYDSSTGDAAAGKKGGSSKLCLSCHDGTIALGDMISRKNKGRSNDLEQTFLKGRSSLGTDLSNDHPISIVFDENLQTTNQNLLDPEIAGLPNADNEIQCSSCHDAHDNTIAPFLHKTTLNGELCTSCHELWGTNWDWASSSHAMSTAEPMVGNPWQDRKPEWKGKNVRENACMNCHVPHNAATPAKLVADVEEKTCYRCHDGTVTRKNIRADKQKFYRHPVEQLSGINHDPTNAANPLSQVFHVECDDCHNPHASRAETPMVSFFPAKPMDPDHATPPFVNGSLIGVSGIDIEGGYKLEADFEYEVCFKCHGVPGKNACDFRRCEAATNYNMTRLDGTYNLREKFDPGNPTLVSYHPIVRNDPNNNNEVPSLRKDIPLDQVDSLIYCSDCHSSDDSPAAGNNGPAGAHGSRFEGLMALRYEFYPQSQFNMVSGSLCLKCHDAGSLFDNDSFPHRLHVIDNSNSCINCHDPHGSASYPHLINFLTGANVGGQSLEITGEGSYSSPTWIDNGQYSGTCYLNCHGTVHDGTSYGPEGTVFGNLTDE